MVKEIGGFPECAANEHPVVLTDGDGSNIPPIFKRDDVVRGNDGKYYSSPEHAQSQTVFKGKMAKLESENPDLAAQLEAIKENMNGQVKYDGSGKLVQPTVINTGR